MADPSRAEAPVVATSVWSYLMARLKDLHRGQELGAFAGPPGIGKTRAINSFQAEHPEGVVQVLVRHPDARPTVVMQAMLAAIRTGSATGRASYPDNSRALSSSLDIAISDWAWRMGRVHEFRHDRPVPLTIIFDEAQNLSPKAIEAVRFWNDGSADAQPVGLVFIGNHQFRLEGDDKGASFLSAAVISRATYLKTFSYANVTDSDVALFAQSLGITDPDAVVAVMQHCRAASVSRDLRQLRRDLSKALSVAGDNPVTADLIRHMFALA